MKKIIFILLLFPVIAAAQHKNTVIVKGVLTSKHAPNIITLSFFKNGDYKTEKAIITEKTFHFDSIEIEIPMLAHLRGKFEDTNGKSHYELLPIFLEKGVVRIKIGDSLETAKVMGSKAQWAFEKLNRSQSGFTDEIEAFNHQYRIYRKENNDEAAEMVEFKIDSIDRLRKTKIILPYLKYNPESPIAFHLLMEYAGYAIDPKVIEPLFNQLPENVRQSKPGKAFNRQIEIARRTMVGAMAPDFSQADTAGNPVSLSDFRGKYVLLDFWASWCGPCRAENPNVVDAFHQYEADGFTVLGVSLDNPGKRQRWLDAIHKDGLTWTHVSDLKGWENEVSKMYGIRAIPQNLLIDPMGKIIAKNIVGDDLQYKLAEIFK